MALDDFWVILGSLWTYDAYMWGLELAVFDLVLARYNILECQGSDEGPNGAEDPAILTV